MKSPLKYYGSDNNTAQWILSLYPVQSRPFAELCCGSAAVTLANTGAKNLLLNDIDTDLMTFWDRVYLDGKFSEFLHEETERNADRLEEFFGELRAAGAANCSVMDTFFRFNLSRNGQGMAFAKSYRVRRKMNENLSRLKTFCDRVLAAHRFFRSKESVRLTRGSAVQVMNLFDLCDWNIYYDPTFVHSTRVAKRAYRYEMTDIQHAVALKKIVTLDAHVVVSGYDNPMYREILAGWRRVDKKQLAAVAAKAGRKTSGRVESFWCNF